MADELSSDLASLKISRDIKPEGGGWLKYVAGLAGTALVLVGAYMFAAPALEAKFFKTEVELTEIVLVSPAEASIELTSTGYLVPQKVSKVASKLPGRVKSVAVVQGQTVKAGDLLFELDPADEQATINAAKSRMAATYARATTAKAQAETARAELEEVRQRAERERALAKEGVSSTGGADDLESRARSLARAVAASEAVAKAALAEVSAAGAEVKTLETSFTNLRVVAPISGTVLNKPPEIGEFVGPQPAGISVDMGGVQLADFASLVVETDVPEAKLHQVKVNGPTEIVLDAFPQKRYRGRVQEITPRVDRAKATVMVRVKFVDDWKGALPDMSARVSFLAEELNAEAMKAPPKIIVPASAVAERSGGKVVFTLEGDKARMVPVQLGPQFGRGYELVQGPPAGARLIANPPMNLVDGQRIKEKTAS